MKVSGENLVSLIFSFQNKNCNLAKCLAIPPRLERGTYCLEGRSGQCRHTILTYRKCLETLALTGFCWVLAGLTKYSQIHHFNKLPGEYLVNSSKPAILGRFGPSLARSAISDSQLKNSNSDNQLDYFGAYHGATQYRNTDSSRAGFSGLDDCGRQSSYCQGNGLGAL